MNNKVKIALLDTGVNASHPHLKNTIVKCYDVVNLGQEYQVVLLEDMNNDYNGHGTACASVIKKECPNIEIHSFRILDKEGVCNLLKLETTLNYIKQIDIKLINLSLAIEANADIKDLSKICNELKSDNKIVISSLSNSGKKSHPAILKDCIGVQGFILNTTNSIWFNRFKKIQCVVDSTPFFHCNINGTYSMFGKSNSYSAAKLTGIVAAIIYENNHISISQIVSNLSGRTEKKYWSKLDLRKSKRFPDVEKYNNKVDQNITNEIENILRKQLNIDKNISLKGKLLLSSEIGLFYEHCYDLIKNIEMIFGFKIDDYTRISRENFYSTEHIANLVHKYFSRKG
jgi:hypothetical protein